MTVYWMMNALVCFLPPFALWKITFEIFKQQKEDGVPIYLSGWLWSSFFVTVSSFIGLYLIARATN